MEHTMLTTSDNPYNPFLDYENWDAWDRNSGYNTNSYIARLAKTSDELSEADNRKAIDDAMQEILSFNLTGNYIIVTDKK